MWRHVDKGTAEGAVDAMLLYGQGKQSPALSVMVSAPSSRSLVPSTGSDREWRRGVPSRKEQVCK